MSVNQSRDVAQSRLTFRRDNAFHKELRRRVDDYFRSSDRRPRDCPAMYLKTAIILSVFSGFYLLLVFAAGLWWQALPLAVLLGLSRVGTCPEGVPLHEGPLAGADVEKAWT